MTDEHPLTAEEAGVLSIVIPVFNEAATLEQVLRAVLDVDLGGAGREVIIVNDCSADQSGAIADRMAAEDPRVRVFHHAANQGKGAALRTGFAHCTGDWVVVQDADLEYDPGELAQLMGPLRSGKADVVYGSRFLSTGARRVLYYWHAVGNLFLTTFSNMMTNLNLTDMETCYKMFRREVIQSIVIRENRFGFEPEITAKVARKKCRVYEMGISYHGRTYQEGKKINWVDGLWAFWCIIKYNLLTRG